MTTDQSTLDRPPLVQCWSLLSSPVHPEIHPKVEAPCRIIDSTIVALPPATRENHEIYSDERSFPGELRISMARPFSYGHSFLAFSAATFYIPFYICMYVCTYIPMYVGCLRAYVLLHLFFFLFSKLFCRRFTDASIYPFIRNSSSLIESIIEKVLICFK